MKQAVIPMKISYLISFLAGSLFISCSNGQSNPNLPPNSKQNKDTGNFEYSLKSAHPNAKALMKDDFFWSPIEETGPFGSDDGSDAAYEFREWRSQHKAMSPVIYLNNLIKNWNYPFFAYNEMDTTKIREYILSQDMPDEADIQLQMQGLKQAMKNSSDTSMSKLSDMQLRELIIASSKELGGTFLLGQDNAIIGTAFAQFVLEGRIDENLKKITITAINRQLLPFLINRYDENYRGKRRTQLNKMLEVIKQSN
jgi:uncharacterized protein YfeS